PSQDMHLTSYLLASLIGSTLTIIPMSTLRNAAGDSQQKGMFSSIGAKALVLFCVLQILPTFISGSIGAIEMYVPLSLAPWQQIASFASCGLLLALFAYACSAKRLPDTMLSALPILLTLCMVLPLGTAKTFTPKPLFILATQLGGNFEILNIYHTRSRYHTRTAAFVFFGQTLVFFGLFAGSMLASGILSNANIEIIESGFYTSFALGGLLVLLAGLVLLLLKTQSEVRVTPNKLPDTLPESTEQPASFSPNEQAIEKLSKHYRLTSRESDMIGYLLSGYSRQKISQELFIAESTVKSHINNLYTKLDIHKRDELLDLVNEFRNKE
ncbi:MAG: helix-turn-helix transcriptional regulator, partial [Raoultibacter sp.]